VISDYFRGNVCQQRYGPPFKSKSQSTQAESSRRYRGPSGCNSVSNRALSWACQPLIKSDLPTLSLRSIIQIPDERKT
jgi:hypothetical protein